MHDLDVVRADPGRQRTRPAGPCTSPVALANSRWRWVRSTESKWDGDPLDAVLVAGEEDVVGQLTRAEPDVVLPLAGGDCDAGIRVRQGLAPSFAHARLSVSLRSRIGARFRERQADPRTFGRRTFGPCVAAPSGPAVRRAPIGAVERRRSRGGSAAGAAPERRSAVARAARVRGPPRAPPRRWPRAGRRSAAGARAAPDAGAPASPRSTAARRGRACRAPAERGSRPCRRPSDGRRASRGPHRRLASAPSPGSTASLAPPRSPTSSTSAASPTTSTSSSRCSGVPVALSASPGCEQLERAPAASPSSTIRPSPCRRRGGRRPPRPPSRARRPGPAAPTCAARSARSMSGAAAVRRPATRRRRRRRRGAWLARRRADAPGDAEAPAGRDGRAERRCPRAAAARSRTAGPSPWDTAASRCR